MQTGCRKRQVGFRVRDDQERVRVSGRIRGDGGEGSGIWSAGMVALEAGAGRREGIRWIRTWIANGGSVCFRWSSRKVGNGAPSGVVPVLTHVAILPLDIFEITIDLPFSRNDVVNVVVDYRVPTTQCVNVVVIRMKIS